MCATGQNNSPSGLNEAIMLFQNVSETISHLHILNCRYLDHGAAINTALDSSDYHSAQW